jgi:mannose-6-phosphate isomerase
MKYFIFDPIYQERVWGGTGFATQLGRELPEGKVIGESWEMVDRPEAQSTTADGQDPSRTHQRRPRGYHGRGLASR